MQSINLIPQQELQEQTQDKAVKFSTVISILLLVIIAGVAGYYAYTNRTIHTQMATLNSEIDALRQKISAKAQVEVNARNLDKKYTTLKEIFASRVLYSMLTREVSARLPAGVVINSITLQRSSKINIAGHADNYISIATFTNNLVNSDFEAGDPVLKPLFTAVTLNSVSLEKSRNNVSFSINVDINSGLLNKK